MSYAGKLLVATPLLVDPNFWRTVVLILQHDEEGTVGVILNRPTEELIEDHLPQWGSRAEHPGRVHFGGPVEPGMAIALAPGINGEPTPVPGVIIVDLAATPPEDLSGMRVYSGYSGWGAQQLEQETAQGSWYVIQASPDDPFDPPDDLWSRVLRRQSGHLALVSTFPPDPSRN